MIQATTTILDTINCLEKFSLMYTNFSNKDAALKKDFHEKAKIYNSHFQNNREKFYWIKHLININNPDAFTQRTFYLITKDLRFPRFYIRNIPISVKNCNEKDKQTCEKLSAEAYKIDDNLHYLEREIRKYSSAEKRTNLLLENIKKIRVSRKLNVGANKVIYLKIVTLAKFVGFGTKEHISLRGDKVLNSFLDDFQEKGFVTKLTINDLIKKRIDDLFIMAKIVFADPIFEKEFGGKFKKTVTLDLKFMNSSGLFTKIMKVFGKNTIVDVPDEKNLRVSLNLIRVIIKEDTLHSIGSTFYHELIHNLDRNIRTPFHNAGVPTYLEGLRAECISVLYQLIALNKNNDQKQYNKYSLVYQKDLYSFFQKVKSKISNYTGLNEMARICSPHAIGMHMALQMSISPDYFKKISTKETTLAEEISKNIDRIETRIRIYKSLKSSKFFIYYKKKVPEKYSIFTKHFLESMANDLKKIKN